MCWAHWSLYTIEISEGEAQHPLSLALSRALWCYFCCTHVIFNRIEPRLKAKWNTSGGSLLLRRERHWSCLSCTPYSLARVCHLALRRGWILTLHPKFFGWFFWGLTCDRTIKVKHRALRNRDTFGLVLSFLSVSHLWFSCDTSSISQPPFKPTISYTGARRPPRPSRSLLRSLLLWNNSCSRKTARLRHQL